MRTYPSRGCHPSQFYWGPQFLLSAVVARLLSSKDHMLFQVIRSFSMFHRGFEFYTMFHQIILKSSQVLWFIKYVSYISVLYSVPNATLYHSRGRGSLTSFWCGCSFYVGNVSSLFRFMSHCLHCQNRFHFIIYLKKYQIFLRKLEKCCCEYIHQTKAISRHTACILTTSSGECVLSR